MFFNYADAAAADAAAAATPPLCRLKTYNVLLLLLLLKICVSRVSVCVCVYAIRSPRKEEIEIILYCSKRAAFYRTVRDTKLHFITR
jgi:hypothetical protein